MKVVRKQAFNSFLREILMKIWSLMPILFLMIIFYIKVVGFLGSGPLWSNFMVNT